MNLRRIGLFLATNLLVMATIWLVLGVTGLWRYASPYGMNLPGLLLFSAVIGFGGAFISLFLSKWMAKTFMGVRVLDPSASLHPYDRWLIETVHAQARKAGITKMPEVGVYDSPEVNAFATGPSRNNSLVAVSSGLLSQMDQAAVEGVLAHEVAHVANGDMVTMTLLQGVVNTFVVFLARIVSNIVASFVPSDARALVYFLAVFVFQIAFGILGSLVVFAFSRYREYRADAGGAALAGTDKMVHALQSLRRTLPYLQKDQGALATMKISGPGTMFQLFSSHPPLEDRIARLQLGR